MREITNKYERFAISLNASQWYLLARITGKNYPYSLMDKMKLVQKISRKGGVR